MSDYKGDRELDAKLWALLHPGDMVRCIKGEWCYDRTLRDEADNVSGFEVGRVPPLSGSYEGMGMVLPEIGKRLFSVRRRFSLELQRLADEATNMRPCVHVAWPDALVAFPDKMPHFVARAAYEALKGAEVKPE